jgi:hypothetical protein
MFERLKTFMLKPGDKMTPFKAFVLGALSKTLATVVRPPCLFYCFHDKDAQLSELDE